MEGRLGEARHRASALRFQHRRRERVILHSSLTIHTRTDVIMTYDDVCRYFEQIAEVIAPLGKIVAIVPNPTV